MLRPLAAAREVERHAVDALGTHDDRPLGGGVDLGRDCVLGVHASGQGTRRTGIRPIAVSGLNRVRTRLAARTSTALGRRVRRAPAPRFWLEGSITTP